MSFGTWKPKHYKKRKKKEKIKKYAIKPSETQQFQQHKLKVDTYVETDSEKYKKRILQAKRPQKKSKKFTKKERKRENANVAQLIAKRVKGQ